MLELKQGVYIGCRLEVITCLLQAGFMPKRGQKLTALGRDLECRQFQGRSS